MYIFDVLFRNLCSLQSNREATICRRIPARFPGGGHGAPVSPGGHVARRNHSHTEVKTGLLTACTLQYVLYSTYVRTYLYCNVHIYCVFVDV